MTPDPKYDRRENLYTSIERLETRKRNKLQLRILGGGLCVAAGLLFWGWYTAMEGRLLLFPSSAQDCRISDLDRPGRCRIRAKLARSFSIREIFGQEIAFKATDETGTINIRSFVKAKESEEPVEIIGAVRKFKTGMRMDAVWIAGQFSWILLLELAFPGAALVLGILLVLLSFSTRRDRSPAGISQGGSKGL